MKSLVPEIYRIAGVLGVDPGPHTWWSLNRMLEGHQEEGWMHTATLEYAVISPWKERGAAPHSALDLHPAYAEEPKKRKLKGNEQRASKFFRQMKKTRRERAKGDADTRTDTD